MRRRRPIWWLPAVGAVWIILLMSSPPAIAQPSPTPCPGPSGSFRPPGPNTEGLAWDGCKFWAADRGETESWIYYCGDPSCDTWVKSFQWKEGRLGTIAWGDRGLWVVDEQRGKIILVKPTQPASSPMQQVTIPPTALRQPPAITGLAWDGGTLWLVTGCGLCSSLYRVDPKTDRVLQALFPRCEPRGLAYAGLEGRGYLWTIAYNGPAHRPRVSLRELTEDPSSVVLSHRIHPFSPDSSPPQFPTNPAAITFALGRLWVVDRAGLGAIFSFSAKATLEMKRHE
jgi:hypothetical protein